MEKETWPMLINNKGYNKRADDRLSKLPDDILFNILSYFTMMEAATSFRIMSRKFYYLWRFSPNLTLENPKALQRLYKDDYQILIDETCKFVGWGDLVIEQHLGEFIQEFKVKFDIDNRIQSTVDRWMAFALAKQVKRITLDCRPPSFLRLVNNKNDTRYNFPIDFYIPAAEAMLSRNNSQLKLVLRYLYLKHMKISEEAIECLLHSCLCLEHLRLENIFNLNQIRVSDKSVSLKCLEVRSSFATKIINLSSTKLKTFKYTGKPVELHITNASLLSDVSIGTWYNLPSSIEYAFDSLSAYYTQFEHLQLQMYLGSQNYFGINRSLVLTKLKHLELAVKASCDQTLLGWVPLIEACPVLQNLTLKVTSNSHVPCEVNLIPGLGRPLKCLKTLEFFGFIGCHIDLELATHVLEHAVILEEVIVDVSEWDIVFNPFKGAREQAMIFKEKLPHNVKFIIR